MSVIGLDIGSRSIKAVQLEKANQGYSLVAAGITATPSRGMASDAEADLARVGEAIKKLLQDAKMSTRVVNLSLPESQVFTRLVTLPPLTDEEVSSAIAWQAEPYIPIPVNEAAIDYQIVARREPQNNQPGGVDVLLVAAPKTLIVKYTRVAEMAGLTSSLVETELLSLSRAIAPSQGTGLILDLGATSTDLAIVRNGQLLMSRSITTAGDVLTRAVASGLSIDMAQAEEYKKTYGLSDEQLEGKVKQAIEPAFRVIADEIKKVMQYYKSELGGQDDVRVAVLSGGTSGLPEIVSYLTENLGIEITIGNPLTHLARDPKLDKTLAAYSPLYSIAIGLAMNF